MGSPFVVSIGLSPEPVDAMRPVGRGSKKNELICSAQTVPFLILFDDQLSHQLHHLHHLSDLLLLCCLWTCVLWLCVASSRGLGAPRIGRHVEAPVQHGHDGSKHLPSSGR